MTTAAQMTRLREIQACAQERRRTIYAYRDDSDPSGILSTIHLAMVPYGITWWSVHPDAIYGPMGAVG